MPLAMQQCTEHIIASAITHCANDTLKWLKPHSVFGTLRKTCGLTEVQSYETLAHAFTLVIKILRQIQ